MDKIILNFIGDIALFHKFQDMNFDPFLKITLPSADYNIANLEFPISEKNVTEFENVEFKYHVEKDFASKIQLEKIHAYSLANNHILDYGKEGVESIVDVLNVKNIKYFGYGDTLYNPLVIEIKNIKLCVLGFCKHGIYSERRNGYGPDDYNVEDILNFISLNKNKYDYIILFPHWGTELVDIPRKNDIKNAHRLIDAGASAVIGHHPHIIQGKETYKGKPIYYSLGSFIYIPEEETGYIKYQKKVKYSIIVQLELTKKEIKSKEYLYYYNKEKLIPEIYEKDDGRKYFIKLSSNINNKYQRFALKGFILLCRELKAFLIRFKTNPKNTTKHYITYIKSKIFNTK